MSSSFRLTLRTVKYAIIVIWILAFLSVLPMLVLLRSKETLEKRKRPCEVKEKTTWKALLITRIVFFIALPIFLTLYCCYKILYGVYVSKTILNGVSAGNEEVKMKRKLVWTTVLATTAFIVFYAPGGIIPVLKCLELIPRRIVEKPGFRLFYLPICIKAVINPYLYAFQSTNYRAAVKHIFNCHKVTVNVQPA